MLLVTLGPVPESRLVDEALHWRCTLHCTICLTDSNTGKAMLKKQAVQASHQLTVSSHHTAHPQQQAQLTAATVEKGPPAQHLQYVPQENPKQGQTRHKLQDS